ELDIQFKDSEQACLGVLAGEFDLGIVTRSPEVDARISHQSIWLDRLVFVAAADHPLARLRSVTLEEICSHPALLPDRKFLTTRVVEELFHERGLEIHTIMSTNNLETIRALISVGYGWGVLPEIMLAGDSVTRLPVADVALHRNLDCIFHRDRSLSRPASCFLELLQSAAAGP
ncbi:MAG: LysR family transcriptional regulator substrate-binding protein, partial [Gammaproteobacteria bacterium]|nr:LysR family transcriptional regulator substrate-binding protein [Gammaproteobacteria bacterium]